WIVWFLNSWFLYHMHTNKLHTNYIENMVVTTHKKYTKLLHTFLMALLLRFNRFGESNFFI
ncbi:MAG: hypothetical protein PHW21_02630, partial [Candidatus Izemoplasmatales bacterium]|nr:hypothetical protein [Candidatus Izemoplasmatales bacterium]